MSEIRLNLIDFTSILSGTIHGSCGDQCVAALSAEPETVDELQSALHRFDKNPFDLRTCLRLSSKIDERPYDAGLMVIDLAARIVVCDSTYSLPGPHGSVHYHDQGATDTPVFYTLPEDWLFCKSLAEYDYHVTEHRERRANPLDARAVVYGRPLLDFLATNIRLVAASNNPTPTETNESTLSLVALIHAQWLLTPRADLRGQSPREVFFTHSNFIESDLETRALQWSMQLEGPPCISRHSYAFRYGGMGFHEWVVYYELIRHLLNETIYSTTPTDDFESVVARLEELKTEWLSEPSDTFDGRIPEILIDNERRRLPEAMGGRTMVIDEDCPVCRAMGDECEAGIDVCFWHLDGTQMDDHFAFSSFATEQEYIEFKLKLELSHREFDRHWNKHQKYAPSENLRSRQVS